MSNPNLNRVDRGGTYLEGKAGLAIHGVTASHLLTATGTVAVFDGIKYTIAAVADITPDAAAVQAAGTTCLYILCVTSAAARSFVKGTEVLTADLTAGRAQLEWPRPTANTVVLGAIKIVTVGVTFTLGTTDFSAAGVTDTYYDLNGRLPVAAP